MTGHIHSSLPLRGLTTNDSQTVADERRTSKNAIPIRGPTISGRTECANTSAPAVERHCDRQCLISGHMRMAAPMRQRRHCATRSRRSRLAYVSSVSLPQLGLASPGGPASGERELRAQEERASDFLFGVWPCVTTGAIPPREWRSVGAWLPAQRHRLTPVSARSRVLSGVKRHCTQSLITNILMCCFLGLTIKIKVNAFALLNGLCHIRH